MQDKHELNITVEEIMEIYPEDFIIPISSNEKFAVLKDMKRKVNITSEHLQVKSI